MSAWRTRWRRPVRRLLPLAGAVIFHLLLLVLIVSLKPLPTSRVTSAIAVSLVSGTGRMATASLPSIAPTPAPIKPEPVASVAKPSATAEPMANQGPSPLLKPKPEPPKNFMAMVVDITSGGSNLEVQPVSITAHPSQAASMPMQTAGGKSCEILETLKRGLQSSDAVKTALSQMPLKSLSVAKAILLWDGRWIDASSVGGSSVLGPIEQSVVQVVSQAPPNCQVEVLHGVRFITLGDAHDTTVLAFGSNEWRWADMLATLSPTTSK